MDTEGSPPVKVRPDAGPDADFADTTWAEEGKGHGRREWRAVRTAAAIGIDWPHAAQGHAHPP